MKIKNLFVGMLAGAAMVACTNEEFDSNVNNAIQTGEKGYVAVNIVAPSTTRAASDFKEGTENEVSVTNAVFLFLDKDLKGCAAPYSPKEQLQFNDAADDEEGIDQKATVLVIDGAKEVPSYIVAVLNPVNAEAYTAETGLAELKAEHATYTTYTTKGKFVMSNAVYKAKNGKEVAATPITMDNIFDNVDDAKDSPVIIQVERVVAKVEVNLNNADESWEQEGKLDDAENKQLALVIDGWDILQNQKSTLVKNINLAWNYNWDWNSTLLSRSYWALSYTGEDQTRNAVDVENLPNKESGSCYVEETVNQTANDEGEKVGNDVNPYLVVAAHFVDAETNQPVSLVEWRGRKYTAEGYLNFIAGNSKLSQYWYKTGENSYSQFSVDLLEMVDDAVEADNKAWLASAQLTTTAAGYDYFTCDYNADGSPVEGSWELVKADADGKSPVVKAVNEFGVVKYWNGGRTYYYTPITHATSGSDKYYGVVRNHWYQVKIKSISGYGTPVSDPTDVIEIPEKPEDGKAYLAAEVVILDWKVVSYGVDLN